MTVEVEMRKMMGSIRMRLARHAQGWKADVPGLVGLRSTSFHATRALAIEELRQRIVSETKAELVDEVVVQLDVPYTEES